MVIFPKDNSFDLEEIPADVLSEIKMVPVSELKEAIDLLMDVNLNTKKTVIVSEVIHNALEN
jgi:ATP-dependent Lon protease